MSNQQEEDDIAKAIQLSLQESKASSSQQVKIFPSNPFTKPKTEISRNMPLGRNAGRGVHHRHKKHITAVKRCLVSLLQYGTPIGSFKQQSFFFSLVAV